MKLRSNAPFFPYENHEIQRLAVLLIAPLATLQDVDATDCEAMIFLQFNWRCLQTSPKVESA